MKNKIVYTLQNGRKLNAREFCKYLYKKIDKTAKKFNLKFNLENQKVYCLDDASIDILYSMFSNKKAKIRKTPFLFCLRKELEVYSKLRKSKFKFISYKGEKLKIQKMLDEMENVHKEIKYSVVKAFLQLS